MSTTKKVEMEYAGPEVSEALRTKPANIFVDEGEVEALIKAGGWVKAAKKKSADNTAVVAAKPEKEVTDG